MSLETIRQLASKRFAEFQGLPDSAKFYPNLKEVTAPKTGVWSRFRIEPVLRYVSSIGSQPCSRRNGSIIIELFDRLDVGTANIIKVADALEQWFSYYQVENLWLGAAKTYFDGQTEHKASGAVWISKKPLSMPCASISLLNMTKTNF